MVSLSRDPLVRLVDRIYEGAVDAQAWPGIVEAVAGYVGGSKGLLLTSTTLPKDGGFLFPWRIPESAIQQWADHYAQHDVWCQVGLVRGMFRTGGALNSTDLIPEREFLESVFYREFLAQLGIARACWGFVFGEDATGLPITTCAVYRDRDEPLFEAGEVQRMRQLVPHLSRALGVLLRLRNAEFQAAATLAALDRIAWGVLLLDARGELKYANREAERLLGLEDGIARRTNDSERFAADDPQTQAEIERMIASTLSSDPLDVEHFARGVQVRRPSGRRPFVLQFASLPETNGFHDAGTVRAIVFLIDPNRPLKVDAALLKRLYRVSVSEYRLLERLCAGGSLGEAAVALGVAESTARTQLRSVFEKTGTTRQAELIKLLVSLASTTDA